LAALVALVVAGSAGGLWWYTGRADRLYRDGVEAFQRGAREVARTTFVQMAQQHPDDARPLVYLGRLSREDGDLARSRRFLTSAVRLAPGSAIAARELAGVMLADGQPELARRFYVRAIELDPTDRMAQGFLGCALARLQRVDEARRWIDRAGPGDWQRCLPPTPLLPPGALPPAVPPALPPS
jgi:Flp pilus assembly protein TadD